MSPSTLERIGAVSLIVIGLTSWPSSEVDAKLRHTQKLRQLFENNIGETDASERGSGDSPKRQ